MSATIGEQFLSFEWFIIRTLRSLKSEKPIITNEDFKELVKREVDRAIAEEFFWEDDAIDVQKAFDNWVKFTQFDWAHWQRYWEVCRKEQSDG
ncbi:MAG: hypothetical protein ACRCT1_07685 [Microcoleaceae cyanobacterium]